MPTSPLLVGVDTHRQTNVVSVMDSQGREVTARVRVDHNRPGTQVFVQTLAEQMATGQFDYLQIAAAATG